MDKSERRSYIAKLLRGAKSEASVFNAGWMAGMAQEAADDVDAKTSMQVLNITFYLGKYRLHTVSDLPGVG